MTAEVLNKMILYFKDDVKRINHALKVYGFATAIAGSEAVTDGERNIIELAAILHDIGIKEAERKYNSSAGNYQEIEGPPIAGNMLKEAAVEKAVIERVCNIIGNHHSYAKIDGIDFQILVESDFLVNIFEDSINIDAVKSIKEKYFMTASGRRFLDSMYLIK